MAFEFGGFVANSFGSRSAGSDVTQGQEMARTVANSVIGSVSSILNSLQSTGASSLTSAISAISALGSFHPSTVSVQYTPPQFVRTNFYLPPSLVLGGDGGSLSEAPDLNITGTTTPVSLPSVSGTAPTIGTIDIPPAPALQTAGGAPVEYNVPALSFPTAPNAGSLGELVLPELTPPDIKMLEVPSFDVPLLPDFVMPAAGTLPDVPQAVVIADIPSWNSTLSINENPVLLVDGNTLVGDKVTTREIRDAVEVLRSRGYEVSAELERAQTDYATERAMLLNAGEERKFKIDQALRDMELARTLVTFFTEAEGLIINAKMAVARSAFEVELTRAQTQLQLVEAATALYNARVSEFAVEAEMYKVELSAQLVSLDKWKAEVEAEISKTRANAQLAQNYAQLVAAVTAKADLYQAQVQATMASVEAHRARMQAVAAEAELARTSITVYSGKTDAYVASLSAYKAQYEAYSASIKGVSAKNQIEQAKTQISVADMAAAGAKVMSVISEIELEAENLRLSANKQAASFENTKLKNTVETIRAQIQGDIGKRDILQWASNAQLTDAKNEAIVDNAQAAVRYYTQASDSAYRAAEQAFRAVAASTQAAMVAQEAAGKTAASVAQGAYSAVHVSASLQGSGRISAQEERSDRAQNSFTDMLNYSEERIQTLSA